MNNEQPGDILSLMTQIKASLEEQLESSRKLLALLGGPATPKETTPGDPEELDIRGLDKREALLKIARYNHGALRVHDAARLMFDQGVGDYSTFETAVSSVYMLLAYDKRFSKDHSAKGLFALRTDSYLPIKTPSKLNGAATTKHTVHLSNGTVNLEPGLSYVEMINRIAAANGGTINTKEAAAIIMPYRASYTERDVASRVSHAITGRTHHDEWTMIRKGLYKRKDVQSDRKEII